MNHRGRLDQLLADKRLADRLVETEEQELLSLKEREAHALEAQGVLQAVAESVQQQSHRQISDIVTRCLKAVFGETDGYEFRINFSQKRGKTEAELCFVRDGKEIDPVSSSGGGTVDVAAFALRLAVLLLSRPRKRRLLILDEPAKWLSVDFRREFRELLELLSKEHEIQMILVSHIPEFITGKVVEL